MIGEKLGGYTILSELGSGGMGTVYLAEAVGAVDGLEPGQKIALKVVHPHLLEKPGFFRRFMQEAELGKRVRHENVVRTFDVDAIAEEGRHFHYMVMEFVEGKSLRQLLGELGTIPETLLREIALQTATGLVAIHREGIIHRDLKPENILITEDHEVRIMDLGVAKLQEATVSLTKEGHFAGTFLYAAPEQFQGAVEAVADLYALGVVLYELAAGANPFQRDSVGAVIQAQMSVTPERLAERTGEISAFFSDVVATLLAKNPAARFEGAAELADVLVHGEASPWWREREHGRAARRLPRIPIPEMTRLYGRGGELEALRNAWEEAKCGAGRVVLVEGEAGIGKTRLVAEFVRSLAGEGAHVLYGSYHAPARSAGLSGSVLQHFGDVGFEDALERYIGAAPGLVPAFAAIARHEVPPSGVAPLQSDALQACNCHLLRGLAAEQPTLWIIDDLQLAPPESRSIVAAMARAAEAQRAMLIVTSRPGLPSGLRDGLAAVAGFLPMRLGRLGPREVIDLLVDAFRGERLAERLGGKIAHRSDGVPLFILEMVRELKSVGLIERDADGGFVQTGPITDLEVPSAVKDLIIARLRDLARPERAILDVGAVQGFEFDPDLVARVRNVRRVHVLEGLAELERRTGVVRAAGRRYRFDQNHIHEVVLGAMQEPLREEYHSLVADAYAAQRGLGPEPGAEDAAVLVWHRLHGARPADGVPLLKTALGFFEGTARFDLATDLLERALGAEGLVTGALRVGLLLRLGHRLGQRGQPDEARARMKEAVAAAESVGDPALRSRAHFQLAGYLYYIARLDESEAESERALEFAREAGDETLEMRACRGLGAVAYGRAQNEDATRYNEQALAMARALGAQGDAASCLQNLGTVALRSGDVARARELLREAAATAALPESKALATYNLGVLHLDIGLWEESRELLAESVRISRECGCRRLEGLARQAQGHEAAFNGDWTEARRIYEDGLRILREVGNPSYIAWVLIVLGEAELEQGRKLQAKMHFDEAIDLAEQAKSEEYVLLARAHKARLEPRTANDVRRALRAEETKARPDDSRLAWYRLWQASHEPGDLERAHSLLQDALRKAPAEHRESIRTRNVTNRAILEAFNG